jgi:hypothetical protein
MTRGVSRQIEYSNPPYVGIGIVVIPYKQNREKFIKQCYRSRQVNLLLESGTVAVKCNVTEEAIQNIKFPTTDKTLGSHVVYVTEKHNQIPYVIGVLDKLNGRQWVEENCFNFSKDIGRSRVNLIGRATGEIILNVDGDASSIDISASGKNSRVTVKSEGEVQVYSQSNIDVASYTTITNTILNPKSEVECKLILSKSGLRFEDLNGNLFEVNKEDGIIKMFEGGEPIVKGSELKKQLDILNDNFLSFVRAFIDSPVVAGDGGAAFKLAVSTVLSTFINADFSKINSEKSFTD